MEFRMFEPRMGCTNVRWEASLGFLVEFLFGLLPVFTPIFMNDRLLNQIGVMAPRIVFRQLVKQPIYDFKRRADAVQGRGQPVHSIYRMCG